MDVDGGRAFRFLGKPRRALRPGRHLRDIDDPLRRPGRDGVEPPPLRTLPCIAFGHGDRIRLRVFPRADLERSLHPSFRVGNVSTAANPDLAAERLRGAETGVSVEPAGSIFRARAVFFWMEVRDAIGNRTLSSTPTLVTRRRENFGTTRSRGIELDLDARWSGWTLTAGYLYSDSTVIASSVSPDLVGNWIPQVPRHQGTLQLALASRGLHRAVQARAGGRQFEDDAESPATARIRLSGRVFLRGLRDPRALPLHRECRQLAHRSGPHSEHDPRGPADRPVRSAINGGG